MRTKDKDFFRKKRNFSYGSFEPLQTDSLDFALLFLYNKEKQAHPDIKMAARLRERGCRKTGCMYGCTLSMGAAIFME